MKHGIGLSFLTLGLMACGVAESPYESHYYPQYTGGGGGDPAGGDPAGGDPGGTNPTNDCGNGVLNVGEDCDPARTMTETCATLGYASGTLRCSASCAYDTSSCQVLETCNNGQLDTLEACEGYELRSETCESQGFTAGTLRCSAACTLDTSGCTLCGNNVLEAGETCDGIQFGGKTCATEMGAGYSGELTCQSCTTVSTSECQQLAGRDEQCGDTLPCVEPYTCDVVYEHPDYGMMGACKQRCSQAGSSIDCPAGEICFQSRWVEPDPNDTGSCTEPSDCDVAQGYDCIPVSSGSICGRMINWCGTSIEWVSDHSSVGAIEAGPTCNDVFGHAMCRPAVGADPAYTFCQILSENGDGVCLAVCEGDTGDLDCGPGYQCAVPPDGFWRVYQEDDSGSYITCTVGDDSVCDTADGFRCESDPDDVVPHCMRPYKVCLPF